MSSSSSPSRNNSNRDRRRTAAAAASRSHTNTSEPSRSMQQQQSSSSSHASSWSQQQRLYPSLSTDEHSDSIRVALAGQPAPKKPPPGVVPDCVSLQGASSVAATTLSAASSSIASDVPSKKDIPLFGRRTTAHLEDDLLTDDEPNQDDDNRKLPPHQSKLLVGKRQGSMGHDTDELQPPTRRHYENIASDSASASNNTTASVASSSASTARVSNQTPPPTSSLAQLKRQAQELELAITQSVAVKPAPERTSSREPLLDPTTTTTTTSEDELLQQALQESQKESTSEEQLLQQALQESQKESMATNEDKLLQQALQESQQESQREAELLEQAIRESQQESQNELEACRENARTLRSILVGQSSVDRDVLEFALSECRRDQEQVATWLEQDNGSRLESLLDLNGILLNAIELGQEALEGSQKPAATTTTVQALMECKDVFSLICMLRQQYDQRLDAALALMQFARQAEQKGNVESVRLRNEIRSLGGIHSLLALFRTRGTMYELRVVAALAVAYVLPSFVVSGSPLRPSLGLKIMECLQFLSTARTVMPHPQSEETISQEECFEASAMALTTFWMNQLEPMLHSDMPKSHHTATSSTDEQEAWPLVSLTRASSTGSRGRVRGGALFDQRREMIELQELLEMTVSLIIHIASQSDRPIQIKGNPVLLVEQVCAVEVARPIAVREGILRILVGWIRSKDEEKIRPAASALRYLTSIKDKYMAGWIHSQMVTEGALPGIVALTQDASLSRDVRLAITQILSSLCVAPHTRAAVVEADCTHFLIDVLYDHSDVSSQEVAFFAGSALLQLAAGAITRASVFSGDDLELLDSVSPDRRDTLVDDIVARGALASFVAIALQHEGKLRSVAVEAIRVLSEDISPSRQTRLRLCEDGAAKALGFALRHSVERLSDVLQGYETVSIGPDMKELHEALCALANILDPIQEATLQMPRHSRQVSVLADPQKILIQCCSQTKESGGLESLLWVASLPFVSEDGLLNPDGTVMHLVEESCRSLALLSPLLLSNDVATKGYSRWADDVLIVLHRVLRNIIQAEEATCVGDTATELHVNVLQGLGALAKSAPLKVRIIDRILPYLLEAMGASDRIDVSNAASQTFQSLDFADDEIAAQVAGNNPNLLADLFCLQRSLLIQAMAREEIRRTVMEIWDGPLKSVELETQHSDAREFFDVFATDKASAEERESILQQYSIIYDERDNRLDLDDRSMTVGAPKRREAKEGSLLARQIYPLNNSRAEMRWMLDHVRFLNSRNDTDGLLTDQLTEHVKNLLDHCFPSQLLRDRVIPIRLLRPDASYNFRAFAMPQRRYFSFRREGQLLSRLCASEATGVGASDVHWTLSFTNSSFAGEFAESLVQVLYLCPMIRGLSFVKNTGWFAISELDNDSKGDDGGALLANLAGSLPPWISYLTFDGIMNDRDLRTLAAILETMGKLSSSNTRIEEPRPGTTATKPRHSLETQTQGKFIFFSIRRSPHLDADAWKSFFSLLGRVGPQVRDLSPMPLSSLKSLDLSGNQLGDDLCALVLELCHDKDSGCRLEELDLSGNRIATGTGVLKVLSGYVQYHRPEQLTGRKIPRKRWKSSLQTLRLASNGLHLSKAWLELVALLKNNALELKELDLSSNKLSLDENEYDSEVLVSSLLKNTFLCHLNLASNNFSSAAIDGVLRQLNGTGNASGLAFLDFSSNNPALTDSQKAVLRSFCSKSRKAVLQRYLSEENECTEGGDSNRDSLRSQYGVEQLDTDLTTKQPWPLGRDATISATSPPGSAGENMITVLFSAPLVFKDVSNNLRPFAKLDFDMERELLWQCLKEASRDIQLFFDSATHNRLLATMAKRCSCLHYSGHGHQLYLPFEDGFGGPHWLEVQKIKDLIAAREGAPPFRFVFVSACHSGLAGETFASAGVSHVVCCQQEFELKDAAALAFTRQFYLALAVGHTVKESFDLGCKAVRATPNLRDADREMSKFVLLPRDGNHNVPIFDAKPVLEWPRVVNDNGQRGRRGSRNSKARGLIVAGARGSEISVRNMMQEDPSPTPPQFFMAREVDMYHVLNAILNKRLVSVVGEVGIGRSSLVCALCHYVNERASTMPKIERIYYVRAKQTRNENIVRQLIEKLLKKMVEAGTIRPLDPDADFETMIEVICSTMKNEKSLIVFDHLELLEDADEANEFPMLVSSLFRETRSVRVLLTACHPLGIPSLGGQVEHPFPLGPLNFANTVRLFANLCPYLHTPADRRKLFEQLATDGEQGELLPNDPNLVEPTKKIFALLGNGIPSRIEKAAYSVTKDEFLSLNLD